MRSCLTSIIWFELRVRREHGCDQSSLRLVRLEIGGSHLGRDRVCKFWKTRTGCGRFEAAEVAAVVLFSIDWSPDPFELAKARLVGSIDLGYEILGRSKG